MLIHIPHFFRLNLLYQEIRKNEDGKGQVFGSGRGFRGVSAERSGGGAFEGKGLENHRSRIKDKHTPYSQSYNLNILCVLKRGFFKGKTIGNKTFSKKNL